MKTRIAKWGHDLALRIPNALAAEANVRHGDLVDVSVENGALIVRPARRRFRLEELVADLAPGDTGEVDWGPPAGKEIW